MRNAQHSNDPDKKVTVPRTRPPRRAYAMVAMMASAVLVVAACGSSTGAGSSGSSAGSVSGSSGSSGSASSGSAGSASSSGSGTSGSAGSASSSSSGSSASSSGAGSASASSATSGSSGSSDSAASNPALDKYRTDGITVGIAGEPPYDFKNEQGEVTGMSPSLGKKILSNLGITKITWTKVDFNGLIPGLQAGRFDMTMAAASINPKRAQAVDYTDPVYCVLEDLAVKKGNPLNLSDYESIKNNPKARLAVESGATEEQYAKAIGVPANQLVSVSNPSALVASVKTGRADAFSLTGITVRSLVEKANKNGANLEALPGFNPKVNGQEQLSCGAPQFRKDETALVQAYNQQLHKLQKANQVFAVIKAASPDGDAFGFAQKQFQEAKKHTFAELSKPQS